MNCPSQEQRFFRIHFIIIQTSKSETLEIHLSVLEIRIFSFEQAWSKSTFIQKLFTWSVNLCIPFSAMPGKKAWLKTCFHSVSPCAVKSAPCYFLPTFSFQNVLTNSALYCMINHDLGKNRHYFKCKLCCRSSRDTEHLNIWTVKSELSTHILSISGSVLYYW